MSYSNTRRNGILKNRRGETSLSRIILMTIGVVIVIFITRWITKKSVAHVPVVYPDVAHDQFLSRKALISKVAGLQSTNDSFAAQSVELEVLRSENTALKAELGRTPAPTGVLAHVLTVPNHSFYDTFVVDAGSAEKIHEGQVVYAFGDVVLGTIVSAQEHTSTVMLLSAPGKQVSGSTVGSDVVVALIGRGAGEYEVRIPREVHFDVGNTIAYQSTNPAVLAVVEKIVTDPRDPFQRLLAKTPINLNTLKWVIIR